MTNQDDNVAERMSATPNGLGIDRYGRIAEAITGRTLAWTRKYMQALATGNSDEMQRLTRQPKIPPRP